MRAGPYEGVHTSRYVTHQNNTAQQLALFLRTVEAHCYNLGLATGYPE
jgi:hypothetical protein